MSEGSKKYNCNGNYCRLFQNALQLAWKISYVKVRQALIYINIPLKGATVKFVDLTPQETTQETKQY